MGCRLRALSYSKPIMGFLPLSAQHAVEAEEEEGEGARVLAIG